MPPALGHPGLRRRWFITQRRVRPDGVVVDSPPFRQHSDLLHRVEDLTVQELVPQLRVEALAVAVFPRTSRFDISRPLSCLRSHRSQIPGPRTQGRCRSAGVPAHPCSPSRRPAPRSAGTPPLAHASFLRMIHRTAPSTSNSRKGQRTRPSIVRLPRSSGCFVLGSIRPQRSFADAALPSPERKQCTQRLPRG